MSGFVPYVFTSAQLVDIRRFCGFPAKANSSVIFPAPWINVQYLALEYRLQNLSQDEGNVVVSTYLTPLYALESAIPTAAAGLNVAVAAVFTRNPQEMRERRQAFDDWRLRLCSFMGIQPGPDLAMGGSCGGSIRQVV